jgi:hypothetical protein
MMRDEEIDAVRSARHEISAECGHDVHKVAAYYRAMGEQLRRARGNRPKTPDKPISNEDRQRPICHE